MKRQPENLKDFFTQYSKDFDSIFEPKVIDIGGDLFVFSKYQDGNLIVSLTKPKNSKHWNLIFLDNAGKIYIPSNIGPLLNEDLNPNPKIEYYCFLSYIKGFDTHDPKIDFLSFLGNKKYSGFLIKNKIQAFYKEALTPKKEEHASEKMVRTIFKNWLEKMEQATTEEGHKDAYRTLDLGELTPDFTKPPSRTYIVGIHVVKEYDITVKPTNDTFVLSVKHEIGPYAPSVDFSFYPKNEKFIDVRYTLSVPTPFDPDICPLLKAYRDAGEFHQKIDIPRYLSFLAKNVSLESSEYIIRYSKICETGESEIVLQLYKFIEDYYQQTCYTILPFDKLLFQNYYQVVENFPDLKQSLGSEIEFLSGISGMIEELYNSKNLEPDKYKDLADLLDSQDTLEKPKHFKILLKNIKKNLIYNFLSNLQVPAYDNYDFGIEIIKDSSEVTGFFQEISDFKETVNLLKEQLELEKKCEVRSVIKIIDDLQKTKYLKRVLEPSMSVLIEKLFDSIDITNVINNPAKIEKYLELKESLLQIKDSEIYTKYPQWNEKIIEGIQIIEKLILELNELDWDLKVAEESKKSEIGQSGNEQAGNNSQTSEIEPEIAVEQMKQEVVESLKNLTGEYRKFLQGKINKNDTYFFDRLRDLNEQIIVKYSNKYISDTMLQLLFYCNARIFQIGKSDKYPIDEKIRVRSSENCINTYNKLTPEEKSLLPEDISIIWEETETRLGH